MESLDPRRVLAFSPFSETLTTDATTVEIAGDFTGDGREDVVLSNGSRIQLLVATGNGSFATPTVLPLTGASIAAGDLNADGKLDLVTSGSFALGHGDGTFAAPIAINLPPQIPVGYHTPVPQSPGSVAVGDINGDGTLDLAVTGRTWVSVYTGSGYYGPYYNNYTSGHVNVLLGNGDGTLLPAAVVSPFSQQSYSESSALAQLSDDNGDNVIDAGDRLDLVVKYRNGDGGHVLLGQGNATLSGATYVPSSMSDKVLLADFDEDGQLDLLTHNSAELILNRGLPSGGFANPTSFNPGGTNASLLSLTVGDINADGHMDIAATAQRVEVTQYGYYYGPYPIAGILHDVTKVVLGNGDGTFSSPIESETGSREGLYVNAFSSLLANFNGDNRPDLATVNASLGTLAVGLNNGSWTPPPALRIGDVSIVEGNSGSRSAVFTVMLEGAHTGDVIVAFATSDGSAAAGSDYTAVIGTLTFAPGVTSRTISIPITVDRRGEGDEQFFVTLSSPAVAVILDGTAVGMITDDEPRISINHVLGVDPLTVVEGDGGTAPAVFTVTLSIPYDQDVTINFSTLTGHTSDIVAASGTLRFLPGESSKNITVQVVGDLIDEELEAFNLILANPSPNASIVSGAGYCFIQDNDPSPTLTISDVIKNEGNSGTTRFDFTLRLSAASGSGLYVSYSTVSGTATAQDYFAKSGTVYFAPGQTTATISIEVKGDRTKEANDTFFVNLTSGSLVTIIDSEGLGTIRDDDTGAPGKGKSATTKISSGKTTNIAVWLATSSTTTTKRR